ncbi:MAG: TetR/AcrR family transcriptional regulator, partial [Burkholderiaceae bacterium]|nr:TetR/AcrR family transcriptional regulator [Burkholderiaceae bacterium]
FRRRPLPPCYRMATMRAAETHAWTHCSHPAYRRDGGCSGFLPPTRVNAQHTEASPAFAGHINLRPHRIDRMGFEQARVALAVGADACRNASVEVGPGQGTALRIRPFNERPGRQGTDSLTWLDKRKCLEHAMAHAVGTQAGAEQPIARLPIARVTGWTSGFGTLVPQLRATPSSTPMAARPVQFEREDALQLALQTFWRHGYEATPVAALADTMGLSKSSLYNSFGSKRDLLLEVIAKYAEARSAAIRRASESPGRLERLQELLVAGTADNDDGQGCLLVNMATELAAHDDDVRQSVRAGFFTMAQAFGQLLIAGKQAGEFDERLDATKTAQRLLNTAVGLCVLTKAGFSALELSPVIEHLLADLRA